MLDCPGTVRNEVNIEWPDYRLFFRLPPVTIHIKVKTALARSGVASTFGASFLRAPLDQEPAPRCICPTTLFYPTNKTYIAENRWNIGDDYDDNWSIASYDYAMVNVWIPFGWITPLSFTGANQLFYRWFPRGNFLCHVTVNELAKTPFTCMECGFSSYLTLILAWNLCRMRRMRMDSFVDDKCMYMQSSGEHPDQYWYFFGDWKFQYKLD